MKIEIDDKELIKEIVQQVVEQLKPMFNGSHGHEGDKLMEVKGLSRLKNHGYMRKYTRGRQLILLIVC